MPHAKGHGKTDPSKKLNPEAAVGDVIQGVAVDTLAPASTVVIVFPPPPADSSMGVASHSKLLTQLAEASEGLDSAITHVQACMRGKLAKQADVEVRVQMATAEELNSAVEAVQAQMQACAPAPSDASSAMDEAQLDDAI